MNFDFWLFRSYFWDVYRGKAKRVFEYSKDFHHIRTRNLEIFLIFYSLKFWNYKAWRLCVNYEKLIITSPWFHLLITTPDH